MGAGSDQLWQAEDVVGLDRGLDTGSDGRGELQVAERRGFAPAGATGLHMVRVLVTP